MTPKSTFAAFAVLLSLASPTSQGQSSPARLDHLRLDSPVTTTTTTTAGGRNLPAPSGTIEVVVRLDGLSVAEANGKDAKKTRKMLSKQAQRDHAAGLSRKQDALMASIRALGGREVARLTKALNAVIVSIDAGAMPVLAELTGVVSVRPVVAYELDLSETVPYIGATAAQTAGIDGAGVRVAVLDSGIDYTHRNLGGPGTVAAYEAAYGAAPGDPRNETLDGLFPTAKVVGGYDFVGETWTSTSGVRTEDPDPIDFQGHGTHVADIIGGASLVGMHKGVAPGVSLYAVKVCSAVSTSCNGVALLRGMDFALDPDGDGDLSDAVDVINMSLGSDYGQIEDDLSLACSIAVRLGVMVVASAGNAADRPYITGSPASTPEVISVAQTHVPSALAVALQINTPASIAGPIFNNTIAEWAPVTGAVTADVAYDTSNPLGNPFPPGSLAGKAALIDRGAITFVDKVVNAANAGAVLVIIANTSGDPIVMGGTAPGPLPPAMMISTADGNRIKSALAAGATVNVTVDPAAGIPLVGSMVSSSSRGPSMSFNAIKPDIGAPGAAVSAEVGTGIGETPFGGTSGAAPMVAGSAALLVQAFPSKTPGEIKALLMNTAETTIYTNPALTPGQLAPITRIGGGEVRADQALAAWTSAWCDEDPKDSKVVKDIKKDQGITDDKKATAYAIGLSFGFNTVTDTQTLKTTVRVTNYADADRTYSIIPTFRYADDAASSAVKVIAPATVKVKKHSSSTFKVEMKIDGSKLPEWVLDGGPNGGNGPLLQTNEFDGYLVISDAMDTIHLPWQVLPQRAAAVKVNGSSVNLKNNGTGDFKVENQSAVQSAEIEIFELLGSSGPIPKKFIPGPGDNMAAVDLKSVGARFAGTIPEFSDIGQIAISTYGRRAHPNYPAGFEIHFDLEGDGLPEGIIFNAEGGAFASSGQNLVFAGSFPFSTFTAFFFTDAQLDSANVILTFPLAVLGLGAGDTIAKMTVYAYDNYFTGDVSDVIETGPYTFGVPRYFAGDFVNIPAKAKANVPVVAVPGGDTASAGQTGILLLYRSAADPESAEVRVKP